MSIKKAIPAPNGVRPLKLLIFVEFDKRIDFDLSNSPLLIKQNRKGGLEELSPKDHLPGTKSGLMNQAATKIKPLQDSIYNKSFRGFEARAQCFISLKIYESFESLTP